MKKHFTISRIIWIILIVTAICFLAYKSYDAALASLKYGAPERYVEVVAPIITNMDVVNVQDVNGMDISVFSGGLPEVLAISFYNEVGISQAEATKKSPEFTNSGNIPGFNIGQAIIDIDKKTRDADWMNTIYQLKTIYGHLDNIIIDLENINEDGLADNYAQGKYDIVIGIIEMCGALDILDGFTEEYKVEFDALMDGIATQNDLEAIDLAVKSAMTINAGVALKLAEHSTISYFIQDIPSGLDGDFGKNRSFFEKILTKNTGSEIVTPIFAFAEEENDSGLKLIAYSNVIFSYKAYDILDYIPQINLFALAGFGVLLFLVIIIPKRGKKKPAKNNDD